MPPPHTHEGEGIDVLIPLFKKLYLSIIAILLFSAAMPASAHNMPLGGSSWCIGKNSITAFIELNSLLFADIEGVKAGNYNPESSSEEELGKIAADVIQPYINKKLSIAVNNKIYPVKVNKLTRNENGLFKIWLSVDDVNFTNPANPIKIDYQLLFDETNKGHINLAYLYLTDAVGDKLQKVLDFSPPDGQFSFEQGARVWEVSIKGSPANAASKDMQDAKNKSVEHTHTAAVSPSVKTASVLSSDAGRKKAFSSRKPVPAVSKSAAPLLESTQRSVQNSAVSNQRIKKSFWSNIGEFLLLGIEHILTGYDHIAFLLALIVIGLSIKEVLKIITAFTIAHSITLLLAATQVVSLNSRIVESVIAFSICFVALENLFKKQVNYRWLLTFGFGLIHGFGFASVLQELIVGKSNLLVSVVSFNLGVEMGQLMIFLVLLPILHLLKNKIEFRKVTVGVSLAIFMLGFAWLIERGFNLKLLPI